MILPGLQSNGGHVDYAAARHNVYCQTWDPISTQSTQVTGAAFTSGTLYLAKLLHPMDRVSVLRRYHGTTGWSGNTSFGYFLYSTDVDVTVLTKVLTLDLTSASSTGMLEHTFTTITGLLVNNPIYAGFLVVNSGTIVGNLRQPAGGAFSSANTGINLGWATNTALNFAIGATALANVAAAPATINVSALTDVTANLYPPYVGLR